MKLKPDCVRDVLLTLEDAPFNEEVKLDYISKQLPNYSTDELWYTCLKLHEGGYIKAILASNLQSTLPFVVSIIDITFSGHQFLDSVRDTRVWAKTKEVAANAGSFTLKTLGYIAQEVAKVAISTALSGLTI